MNSRLDSVFQSTDDRKPGRVARDAALPAATSGQVLKRGPKSRQTKTGLDIIEMLIYQNGAGGALELLPLARATACGGATCGRP